MTPTLLIEMASWPQPYQYVMQTVTAEQYETLSARVHDNWSPVASVVIIPDDLLDVAANIVDVYPWSGENMRDSVNT